MLCHGRSTGMYFLLRASWSKKSPENEIAKTCNLVAARNLGSSQSVIRRCRARLLTQELATHPQSESGHWRNLQLQTST